MNDKIIIVNNDDSTIHYYTINDFKHLFARELQHVSYTACIAHDDLDNILAVWNNVYSRVETRPVWEFIEIN